MEDSRMQSGSITFNGMTDRDLIEVLKVKEKHEGALEFNPQQAHLMRQLGSATLYNNVILTWQQAEGAKAILHLIERLLEGESPTSTDTWAKLAG
jgi:hypothetical protein